MTIEIPEMILLAEAINRLFAARALTGVRRWVDTEVGVNEAGKKSYESRHEDLNDFAGDHVRLRAREAGRALLLEVVNVADESSPVVLGAYVLKFGLKGWMGAVDAALAVVDSDTVLKPVSTRQRVATAPLLVVAPSRTAVSRWKHVRYSFRFADDSMLRLMDDSRSAEGRWVPATSVDGGAPAVPPSELPRSIGSVGTPEELTALIRAITHEASASKSTLLAAIMKRAWSYGLGEVTLCEWFHRACVSPYVSVVDAVKNDGIVTALGGALHAVINDRVRGVELAIYELVDKTKNIGAVKNVYYNKESCAWVESEPPKARRATGGGGSGRRAAIDAGTETETDADGGDKPKKRARAGGRKKKEKEAVAATATETSGAAEEQAPKKARGGGARKKKVAAATDSAAAAADGAADASQESAATQAPKKARGGGGARKKKDAAATDAAAAAAGDADVDCSDAPKKRARAGGRKKKEAAAPDASADADVDA